MSALGRLRRGFWTFGWDPTGFLRFALAAPERLFAFARDRPVETASNDNRLRARGRCASFSIALLNAMLAAINAAQHLTNAQHMHMHAYGKMPRCRMNHIMMHFQRSAAAISRDCTCMHAARWALMKQPPRHWHEAAQLFVGTAAQAREWP